MPGPLYLDSPPNIYLKSVTLEVSNNVTFDKSTQFLNIPSNDVVLTVKLGAYVILLQPVNNPLFFTTVLGAYLRLVSFAKLDIVPFSYSAFFCAA